MSFFEETPRHQTDSGRGQVQEISLDIGSYTFEGYRAGPLAAPLVLFLHGFPQFADAWRPILSIIADRGFHAIAINQRGYSPGARPSKLEDYATDRLVADVLAFADALGYDRFHLVGHDWGGMLAWQCAAQFPQHLYTLTVLSTPHTTAILLAIKSDRDQAQKSAYINFFRLPDHAAETGMLANDAERLRGAYRGRVAPETVENNVRRLRAPGALTAALNWYRALDMDARIGTVRVPTLYIWGEEDHALGEAAALATEHYVDAAYRFVRLAGKSHWLLEEAPETIADLLEEYLRSAPPMETAT